MESAPANTPARPKCADELAPKAWRLFPVFSTGVRRGFYGGRGQTNTAKMLERNQTLMRIREPEVLEKIACPRSLPQDYLR